MKIIEKFNCYALTSIAYRVAAIYFDYIVEYDHNNYIMFIIIWTIYRTLLLITNYLQNIFKSILLI